MDIFLSGIWPLSGPIRAVRTVTMERIVANQGGMDIFWHGIWPLVGQIRAVRTEFAVTIERIVANQGGMDIFLCGIWPFSGQNQGGTDGVCSDNGPNSGNFGAEFGLFLGKSVRNLASFWANQGGIERFCGKGGSEGKSGRYGQSLQ